MSKGPTKEFKAPSTSCANSVTAGAQLGLSPDVGNWIVVPLIVTGVLKV